GEGVAVGGVVVEVRDVVAEDVPAVGVADAEIARGGSMVVEAECRWAVLGEVSGDRFGAVDRAGGARAEAGAAVVHGVGELILELEAAGLGGSVRCAGDDQR